MNSATIIAVLAIAVILFAAVRYIYKEKKKGNACIGCPYASSCHKYNSGAACQGTPETGTNNGADVPADIK